MHTLLTHGYWGPVSPFSWHACLVMPVAVVLNRAVVCTYNNSVFRKLHAYGCTFQYSSEDSLIKYRDYYYFFFCRLLAKQLI